MHATVASVKLPLPTCFLWMTTSNPLMNLFRHGFAFSKIIPMHWLQAVKFMYSSMHHVPPGCLTFYCLCSDTTIWENHPKNTLKINILLGAIWVSRNLYLSK